MSLLSCCRPQRIALIFTCLWVSSISPVVSARPFALNLDRLEQAIESLYARVAATLQSHTGGTSGDEQAPFAPILLDCGSSVDYTDSKGNVWKADAHYSAASESYLECPTDLSTVAVDAEIYCSDRWFNRFAAQEGPLGYEIPMSLGSYTVTLHFSETFFAEQNQRVFDVAMENGANRTIDIVKDAGGSQRAYTVSEEVQVTDGFLSIEFFSVVENPKISAIEVYASTTSMPPTTPAGVATYVPGLLTVEQDGLILSEGLTARILAVSNAPATYHNGQNSTINVHTDPDAGACFPDLRPGNEGGWIYVSNSEAKPAENSTDTPGGVGAFTFDSSGNLIDYNMVLEGTIANCGGGKTPWGAWISGEERKDGMIWQVDPTGEREPAILTMSNPNPGMFESFAYDARNTSTPRFFMSKDDTYGEFRRL